MSKILTGNISKKIQGHPESGGWFLGHFMPPGDIFHSEAFEMKWSHYPEAGVIRKGSHASSSRQTLTILIQGKGRMVFSSTESILLESQGDYIVFDSSQCEHTFESLEKDTILLTIRTPSQHE